MLHLRVLQSLRQKQVEMAHEAGISYWDDRAVRVAGGRESSPLFVITTGATGLDPHAAAILRLPPADIGRVGFAIGHAIDRRALRVEGLPEETASVASAIASALEQAERPLIISGVTCRSEAVLKAAANIAWALRSKGKNASLCLVMPECNSFGLGLLSARGLDAAFEDAHAGADVAIVLENDLYRRAEMDEVDDFLLGFRQVVVIDHLFHRTALKADMVLPAATFAEADGTLVNNEGRAQRYFQVFPADGEVRPSWQWLTDIMASQGHRVAQTWHSLDDLIVSMAGAVPLLGPVAEAAPQAAFRVAGMRIAREHQRSSGRTAVNAAATVHEQRPPHDANAPFTFSMEGYGGRPPSALIPRFWAPGWNSVQSVNKFQAEVGGPLAGGDPGIRLIEPAQKQGTCYFEDIPEPFSAESGLFLVVPCSHVFGSDELSMLTPGVRERAPAAYLAMSARDMADAHLNDGDAAVLSLGGRSYMLPARTAPELASGVAAVPCGVPDAPVLAIPAFGQVEKAVP
jgi:NADH-quinone oxidoreductase subunit G